MATTVSMILDRKGWEVVTIPPAATLGQAAKLLTTHGIGAVVVSGDGEAVDGILSERDIVRRFASDDGVATASVAVSTAMTSQVFTAQPSTTIDELVKIMTDGRFRHVPVVEGDKLAGIVSIGDVVKSRLDQLQTEAESLQEYVTGNSY